MRGNGTLVSAKGLLRIPVWLSIKCDRNDLEFLSCRILELHGDKC